MVTLYKFNGKELDQETGMYYYGARYYIPELSIWGSVDPLSDKSPNESPFTYCSGNPVMLIDPNGASDILVITGEEADVATDQLQQKTPNLILTKRSDGVINYTGTPVTDFEKRLTEVIDNQDVIAEVDARNYNLTGAFMGTELSTITETINIPSKTNPFETEEIQNERQIVTSKQEVNPSSISLIYKNNEGAAMLHEVTECFELGKLSLKIGDLEKAVRTIDKATGKETLGKDYMIYNAVHNNRAYPQPGPK